MRLRVARKLLLILAVLILLVVPWVVRNLKWRCRLTGLANLEKLPVALCLVINSLNCLIMFGPSWRGPERGETLMGRLTKNAGRTRALLTPRLNILPSSPLTEL